MVNLVFRHQDEPSLPARNIDIKPPTTVVGRGMSSPGRMRTDNYPVSPLTQNESMFGAGAGPYQPSDNNEERDQPPLVSLPSGNNLEMICDYDRSVTQLYEMLESSQWENACSRCQSHPEEVHTWIVRRDANGNARWKLLPLHAAVIFKAPLSLIEDLLRVHPIAAAKRDDQGILPLHLAFRHKSNEAVIEKLLHQYPGGVIIKDHRERLPLDHGKDMRFSAKLLGLYAETFTKCQHIETTVGTNDAEIAATYENRMTALKDAYEARIVALQKNNEQAHETTKIQVEKDLKRNRENHMIEMVELRSQLAIEKMAGERTPGLEAELRGLSSSLGDANRELIALRKVVQEQKEQKESLVDEMSQILEDQKALHGRCNKQQEQLDQTQKLREQLLRTLIQKENGKTIQVSNEICQLSENNIARTEKLLNNQSLAHSYHTIGDTSRGLPNNISQNPDNVQSDSNLPNNHYQDTEDLPSDCENPATTGDVGDDISAITENSYTHAFGDR
jgi:hypothetical protein